MPKLNSSPLAFFLQANRLKAGNKGLLLSEAHLYGISDERIPEFISGYLACAGNDKNWTWKELGKPDRR